jgi:hypothetical protein
MRVVLLVAIVLACASVASASTATAPRAPPSDAKWYSFCSAAPGQLNPVPGIKTQCNSFGYFDDKIETTGWSYLHVESNFTLGNDDQAYAVGFAEGFLTANRIKQSISNSFASTFTGGVVPQNVRDWIATQQQYVADSAGQSPGGRSSDIYAIPSWTYAMEQRMPLCVYNPTSAFLTL